MMMPSLAGWRNCLRQMKRQMLSRREGNREIAATNEPLALKLPKFKGLVTRRAHGYRAAQNTAQRDPPGPSGI